MKKSEMIALALVAAAAYMLITAKRKTSVTSADGPIPERRTPAELAYTNSLGAFAG